MTTNTSLGLSRRTILAGLGSVGAIGVAGRVGSGLLADSQRFPRHTLASSNGDNDLLVTWQQWYSPTADDRRAVNAHPDDDGDGVQSYAGTTYDVAAGESALEGAANACCEVPNGAFAIEQSSDGVTAASALDGTAGIQGFYDDRRDDLATPGTVRTLLYRDEMAQLYLVVFLGNPPSGDEGSTVGFDFPGRQPVAGDWVVQDGDGSFARSGVEFTWDSAGGGAYGPLESPFAPIVAVPNFSALSNPDGAWEFLWDVTEGSDGADEPAGWTAPTIDESARLAAHCGIASGDDVPIPEAFRSDLVPGQTALIELSDVVPGDSGEVIFDVRTCNTDANLWLVGTAFEESPGFTTEPERERGPDEANLAENVLVDVRYAVNKAGPWSGTEPSVFDSADPTTLADVADVFEGATVIDDVLGGANAVPLDGDDATEGRSCLATGDVLSVRVTWEIPTSVGNEIQGDEIGFTLGFYAEQCENTDTTTEGSR